ncbi:cell wall / vacuolar inhibitor of fructosidase 1-like [Andrographis paniculata]|uniref:cell wall / vacuolar inhibitor of fructosidase 1-like n=1 Tax=Andrographis paniculata TaxID=175694 RepID=UPI0021E7854E|nr:cell wall / vacuolar inhibitor of fructosidase 1-like [Andrographis paniculata]
MAMRTQFQLISLVFVLLLLLLSTTTTTTAAAISSSQYSHLIESTCKNTPHFQLCMTTLLQGGHGTTADVAGLALIMVRAVRDKTRAAISTLKTYPTTIERGADPRLVRALQDCARAYNAVMVADVPEAVEALTKGDPKFAENGMADAAVEADVCEDAIAAAVGAGARNPSPIAMRRMNKAVRELAEVARAIIRNLL